MNETFQKILDENKRLWQQLNKANNDKEPDQNKDITSHLFEADSFHEYQNNHEHNPKIISPKPSSAFKEKEVKLEEKLKEIERKRNKSKP